MTAPTTFIIGSNTDDATYQVYDGAAALVVPGAGHLAQGPAGEELAMMAIASAALNRLDPVARARAAAWVAATCTPKEIPT